MGTIVWRGGAKPGSEDSHRHSFRGGRARELKSSPFESEDRLGPNAKRSEEEDRHGCASISSWPAVWHFAFSRLLSINSAAGEGIHLPHVQLPCCETEVGQKWLIVLLEVWVCPAGHGS